MRRSGTALRSLVLAAALTAGCGDDEPRTVTSGGGVQTSARPASSNATTPSTAAPAPRAKRSGTRITVADSEFGPMLWGPDRQAIYIFERDSDDRSRCSDECAEAWPPVYTEGRPTAGRGLTEDLLGTLRRDDGRLQVSYAGQPLYYYAHEGPGQVLCHDVFLNGGLWWVVGPDGKRRP